MGLFSKKCPIHRIELSVGKNYMCQYYYYCKKCLKEKKEANAMKAEQDSLRNRIEELEKQLLKT